MDEDEFERHARGHLLLELGFQLEAVGDELRGGAAITPEMCVPGTDALRTSILATWADMVTGWLAVGVFAPRVPVTLELDVHLYRPLHGVREVRVVGRSVKAGRSVVVSSVEVTDAGGGPLAIGTGTFMASPNPAAVMPGGRRTPGGEPVDVPPLRVPLAERAGCERRAPGLAVLPRRDDGLNASGTVNGGLLALAAEEAALSAAPPGTTLASMAIRYLRPVRTGPAVATASVHEGLGRVEVVDAADGDLSVVVTTRAF